MSSAPVSLSYAVRIPRPPADARLEVDRSGRARLFLGSSWSLPYASLDRVGWFGGLLPPDAWRDLAWAARLWLRRDSSDRGPVEEANEGGGRRLTVRGDEGERSAALSGDGDPLEQLLLGAMAGLVTRPLGAVRVALEVAGDAVRGGDAGAAARVGIVVIGDEPCTVVLEDDPPGSGPLALELTSWLDGRATTIAELAPAAIGELVGRGELRPGPIRLEPGSVTWIDAPSVVAVGGAARSLLTATIRFRILDGSPDETDVVVQTLPVARPGTGAD